MGAGTADLQASDFDHQRPSSVYKPDSCSLVTCGLPRDYIPIENNAFVDFEFWFELLSKSPAGTAPPMVKAVSSGKLCCPFID